MSSIWGTCHFTAENKRESTLKSIMVIALDMNFLKILNDTFGHKAGDIGLKALAELLSDFVRDTDTVARIGGDEYLVVMPIQSDKSGIHEKIFQRLLKRLDQLKISFTSKDSQIITDYKINTAAGFSIMDQNQPEKTVEKLREDADKALYKNKEAMKEAMKEAN